MAKVTAPLGSGEARGKLGGFVYNTWRGISTVRSLVTPKNEFTGPRIAMHDLLKSIAPAWAALDDHTRQLWRDFAIQHVEVDWTGNDIVLPAWNWWIRTQMLRAINELGASVFPPTHTVTTFMTNIDFVNYDPDIDVTWQWPGTPDPHDYFVEAWLTHVHSPGRSPTLHDAHRLGHTIAAGQDYYFICPEYGYYTAFLRPVHFAGLAGPWQSIRINNL